jgi:hypothetical protein
MSFLEEIHARVGVTGIVLLIIALYFVKEAFDLMRDPLRDIPGPFLARFTRLWLLRQYVKGKFQKTNLQLHEQYGMSPNICGLFLSDHEQC